MLKLRQSPPPDDDNRVQVETEDAKAKPERRMSVEQDIILVDAEGAFDGRNVGIPASGVSAIPKLHVGSPATHPAHGGSRERGGLTPNLWRVTACVSP